MCEIKSVRREGVPFDPSPTGGVLSYASLLAFAFLPIPPEQRRSPSKAIFERVWQYSSKPPQW